MGVALKKTHRPALHRAFYPDRFIRLISQTGARREP